MWRCGEGRDQGCPLNFHFGLLGRRWCLFSNVRVNGEGINRRKGDNDGARNGHCLFVSTLLKLFYFLLAEYLTRRDSVLDPDENIWPSIYTLLLHLTHWEREGSLERRSLRDPDLLKEGLVVSVLSHME